jgi:hypothetical protein
MDRRRRRARLRLGEARQANKRGGLAIRLTLFRLAGVVRPETSPASGGGGPVGCGHGRSKSGEDRGGVGQRAARAAPLGPSGGAETTGWLGDCAGSRTRRWPSGGDRKDTCPVSRRLGKNNKRAQELLGVLVK